MNSDADYSYAEPESVVYAPSSPSLHLPFALLSSAIAIVMVAQFIGSLNQKSALRAGLVKLASNEKTLGEAFSKREPLVKQSGELKNKLNAMVMDLLILGKTDEDAKAIIGKYNIQQNQPGGSSEATEPR